MSLLFRRLASTSVSSSALSSSHSAPPSGSSQFFKITLFRSSIGLSPAVRKTVAALELKKRMQTVYQPVRQDTIGKILKVKELVKVETVSSTQMERERQPRIRSENKGYTVIGRVGQ